MPASASKTVCGNCYQTDSHLLTCSLRRLYFVSVIDGARHGYLLGPYDTHEEAKANVDRGRELAMAADLWAHFHVYGTCSVLAGVVEKYPGFKPVFGK